MPHQFQTTNCKKCAQAYCPVCKEKCSNCDEVDIGDKKTMEIRELMRKFKHRGELCKCKHTYGAHEGLKRFGNGVPIQPELSCNSCQCKKFELAEDDTDISKTF